MKEEFRLDNQLCFRLYTASRLIARQMIVKLTKKGRNLQNQLSGVPQAVGSPVLCKSVTPETVPGLFGMLDDIIHQLKDKQDNK